MRLVTILVILFTFIITPFSYAEVHEEIIKLNEENARTFIKLTLTNRGMYYISHKTYPKSFFEFMDGFDMGGDIGKIKVNELGKIELLGYIFTYYSNEDSFKFSAEPISPEVTGKIYFAVGTKPDGTGYLAEDINKNGSADLDEPQLEP